MGAEFEATSFHYIPSHSELLSSFFLFIFKLKKF